MKKYKAWKRSLPNKEFYAVEEIEHLIGLIILLIFEIIFIVIILIIVVVLLRPALGLASALHLLREECKYLIVGGGGLRNELFEFLHICLLQAFYALDLYFLLTQSTRYL